MDEARSDEGTGPRRWEAESARCLARRPLTSAELTARLVDRGASDEAALAAVETCRQRGWIDDRALAEQFLEARAERMGHGRDRLLAQLVARGVDRDVARDAWRAVVEDGRVQPAALLEGRVARLVAAEGGRLTPRAAARVIARLRRAGFAADEVMAQVSPHLEFEPPEAWSTDEIE